MVITRYKPIHALLYLVVSFMAVSMIFLSLGAPFVAALEIILYAGAIIVLMIFVVMMLNLGPETAQQEKAWLQPRIWAGPSLLALVLMGELIYLLLTSGIGNAPFIVVDSKKVALSLYGEYVIAVELAGFLLMAGIVGAAHIGKHRKKHLHRFLQEEEPTGPGREVRTIKPEEEKRAEPVGYKH